MSEYNSTKAEGWVCFDATCPYCVRWANRARGTLEPQGFIFVPLQSDWARRALNVPDADLLREMRVVTADGKVIGGADALLYLARRIRWTWPLWALAGVPGAKPLMRAVYRIVAANRTCSAGVCAVNLATPAKPARNTVAIDSIPLVALTALAFTFGRVLPAWVWMWLLCFALFFGCKWVTFRAAVRQGLTPGKVRALGYLFAWVGMDARAFLSNTPVRTELSRTAWLRSGANVIFGTALLMAIPRLLLYKAPLLAGWAGMVGLILILHFGLFELLATAWQKAGVNAVPLMRSPTRSCSLGEFWGRRWNTGFHQLAHDLVFRRLHRRWGPLGATAVVFALSGLIHELVISVPARGGYGFPILYFLLQGAGVLFERSQLGRRFGLGSGARGWFFTMAVTVAPAFWLFHPPFIHHVILPMLRAIGAT